MHKILDCIQRSGVRESGGAAYEVNVIKTERLQAVLEEFLDPVAVMRPADG